MHIEASLHFAPVDEAQGNLNEFKVAGYKRSQGGVSADLSRFEFAFGPAEEDWPDIAEACLWCDGRLLRQITGPDLKADFNIVRPLQMGEGWILGIEID